MRALPLLLLLFLAADSPTRPEQAIKYFTNFREVRISHPDHQNFFVVDEELWNHSRPDLADLRLYDGETSVQYALSEQTAGLSSEEADAKILNLGSVHGHTEFDLDANGNAEYDRIRLRLDAHDFVATAAVSGGNTLGKTDVELPSSTLYDFRQQQLGSNFQLKLPASSFRYLHVKLSPGIRPAQVQGATVINLREQQASWTRIGSCAAPQSQQHATTIVCTLPEKVPLNRVTLQVPPAQGNFHRIVTIQDPAGVQICRCEITRVRINRGGTLVTNENLALNLSGNYRQITIRIDNGDNPPLDLISVRPWSSERRVYFDPQGKSELRLYYGDPQLSPPIYDYARFFHADASAEPAQLGPGSHNPQYSPRPDSRPWSERHSVILWSAMLIAVLILAGLALRGLRADTPVSK